MKWQMWGGWEREGIGGRMRMWACCILDPPLSSFTLQQESHHFLHSVHTLSSFILQHPEQCSENLTVPTLQTHSPHSTQNKAARILLLSSLCPHSKLICTAAPRWRRWESHHHLHHAYIFPQAQSHWQRELAWFPLVPLLCLLPTMSLLEANTPAGGSIIPSTVITVSIPSFAPATHVRCYHCLFCPKSIDIYHLIHSVSPNQHWAIKLSVMNG